MGGGQADRGPRRARTRGPERFNQPHLRVHAERGVVLCLPGVFSTSSFPHVSTDLKGGRIVRANVEVSESCWGGTVLVWGGPCEGTFPIQCGPPFFPQKPGFASWPPPPTWSTRPVGHPACLIVGSRGFYHGIGGKYGHVELRRALARGRWAGLGRERPPDGSRCRYI